MTKENDEQSQRERKKETEREKKTRVRNANRRDSPAKDNLFPLCTRENGHPVEEANNLVWLLALPCPHGENIF